MLKTTESFNSNIKNMWGSDDNRATRIAKEAMNELFRHGEEISLDYDDQTGFALKVGILAGRTENGKSSTGRGVVLTKPCVAKATHGFFFI